MLPPLSEYEFLIYGLPDRHSSIRQSSLVVIRHGPTFAELFGTVEFEGDVTLSVWEDLDPVLIEEIERDLLSLG